MKKKSLLLIILSIFLFINIDNVHALEPICTREAAEQVAKIVYHETGADTASDSSENFFMRMTTASIVLNNASNKDGDSLYQKLYNLTDNNYANYSSYKDKSFDEAVPNRQGEMLYIAKIVMSGKYNVPKNMTIQASEEIVNTWGTVWYGVAGTTSDTSVYFGYEGSSLSSTDVFGNTISDNSANAYKKIANSLKLSDYSQYNSSNICSGVTDTTATNNKDKNKDTNTTTTNQNQDTTTYGNSKDTNSNIVSNKEYVELGNACENPAVLKIMRFMLILIDVLRIGVPIALIIVGSIDLTKAVIYGEEKDSKKHRDIFIKRLIYAMCIFAVPWIVKTTMILLGNLTDGVNFTDCLENATAEKIEYFEGK